MTLESVRDNWDKIVDMEGGDFPTSNQGATMELVAKLHPLSQEPSDANNEELDLVEDETSTNLVRPPGSSINEVT